MRHHYAKHQAFATHASKQIGVIANELLQRRTELVAGRPHLRQKFVIRHNVPNRLTCRHRKRVAAVGRSMRANDHAACRFFGSEASANREAAAKALCGRHDVGDDAVLFIGIKRA